MCFLFAFTLYFRTEPQVFKSKFNSWDNVIAVDFTRTADSVAKTGVNLHQWMSKQDVKIDTSALFMLRQPEMSKIEARQLSEEWNEDKEAMQCFILEGRKLAKLHEDEIGHFYSTECYVILCRYWMPPTSDDELNKSTGSDEETDKESDSLVNNYQYVVYFWQGREAPNMGWLTFTFSLQKMFQALFGNRLEIVRTYQQQESYKFLSHFNGKFVIHLGKRQSERFRKIMPSESADSNDHGLSSSATDSVSTDVLSPTGRFINEDIEMYYLRSNSCPLTFRCVQVQPEALVLNSGFSYILKVPRAVNAGVAYVWIGDHCDEEEAKLAEQIALEMFDTDQYRVSILAEGEEPDEFWAAIGGRKTYEKEATFMRYTRLFRCSNDKGYFAISEKCSDFCQDDLADEDIMILDNGTQVFIWVGTRCSDVEVKLACKSAQVYVQNMRIKQEDRPRQLMLTFKGKETRKFTKCFHGWNRHRVFQDPRAEYLQNKEVNGNDETD